MNHDWAGMGWEARMRGARFDPPVLRDPNDPRTLAWIDGWECADHELKWKTR